MIHRRTLALLTVAGFALAAVTACGDSSAGHTDSAIAGTITGEPSRAVGAPGETTTAETPTTAATTTTLDPYAPADDFYAVPDPLPPGQPGDLIRAEQVPTTDTHISALWRVLYHSESVAGDDIAVSGLVAVPKGDAPPDGRPVVSWAHGTTGIADVCAPSKDPDAAVQGLADPLLDEGMVIAATDYEGLGTPNLHPYIVGESEARGVIDIVRATRQLRDADAGTRFAVWGHSQGGHAAMFANQIAASWAPELQLVGTVAGAPATELPLIAVALRDSPFRYYLIMAAAGWNAAYPDADLHLVLSDEAIARIGVVDDGCTGAIDDAYKDMTYDQIAIVDPSTVEPWKTLLMTNDPGHVISPSPVFIYQGGNDEQIPVAASQLLFDRLCGLGQVVSRTVYAGQSHAGVVPVAFPDIKSWIDARFAGDPAPSTCSP